MIILPTSSFPPLCIQSTISKSFSVQSPICLSLSLSGLYIAGKETEEDDDVGGCWRDTREAEWLDGDIAARTWQRS
jgi:hypothetical protein